MFTDREQQWEWEKLQDEIELLREQIKTYRSEISCLLEQQQQLEEELYYTNRELRQLNDEMLQMYREIKSTFDKAKEGAKIVLADEKPARESLVEFFIIYGEKFFTEELERVQKSVGDRNAFSRHDTINFPLPKIFVFRVELRAKNIELKSRFVELNAKFTKFKAEFAVINNMLKTNEHKEQLSKIQSSQAQPFKAVPAIFFLA